MHEVSVGSRVQNQVVQTAAAKQILPTDVLDEIEIS